MTTPLPVRPPQVLAATYLFSGLSALWLGTRLATLLGVPAVRPPESRHGSRPRRQSAASALLVLVALAAMTGAVPALLLSASDRPAA
ncbi:hypothetical protein ACLQ3B_22030 [Micromonospora sp. DT53]|uniref:hypothetical protein n=1 Tax=Micromonospora sp. DT53 TaxID=3393444 RepID=UPI003CED9321